MTFLDRSNQFLDVPLNLGPRVLIALAAGVLTMTLTQPLWNMTMFAPQYGDGLRLDIYTHGLEGGNKGQDLKEINLLNHYIGMRDLSNEDFTEFNWMPFAIGALGLLFLRAAVHGRMSALVDAFVLFCYFGTFSLWSFGAKRTSIKATPRADGAGQGPSVQPADVRVPEARELRGVFVPGRGHVSHDRHRGSALRSAFPCVVERSARSPRARCPHSSRRGAGLRC
jgi:hypothetical protein